MTILDNPLKYYFNIWKDLTDPNCYYSDSDTNSNELSDEFVHDFCAVGKLRSRPFQWCTVELSTLEWFNLLSINVLKV